MKYSNLALSVLAISHLHYDAPSSSLVMADWLQIGQDVNGEGANDHSGYSASISSDGSKVAIGARYNSNVFGIYSGHVRVYELMNGVWDQLGQDIDGETGYDYSGYSVSISSDGFKVAIGAFGNDDAGTNSGQVRVYEYVNGIWIQLGQDIDGESSADSSGHSVSISSDGFRVAVGAYANDDAGTNSGQVRVYEYLNGVWGQLGQDIDGEAANDHSGYSVSISSDGSRVAVGAYLNDGSSGTDKGHARVYEILNNLWVQVGQDIDGENSYDWNGRSVSLSSNGSRVAVGARYNDDAGFKSGQVRVYELLNNFWIQLGQDLEGEAAEDYSGTSVSISLDGSRVAIGAPGNDDGGYSAGQVRVYELMNGFWVQLGGDIDGESGNDNSGISLSISSDGLTVAIGAYLNDDAGNSAGQVKVYHYDMFYTPPPSMAPSIEPPSMAPSIGPPPVCVNSPLDFTVSGYTISCSWIELYATPCNCYVPGVPSHCPWTCGTCNDFSCDDSQVGFTFNGYDVTCAIIATQPPGTISLACNFPEIFETCRDTCGYC